MSADYGVEPHEVDTVWAALVGDAEPGEAGMPRWVHLSSRAALLTAVQRRITDERATIAANWSADGDSYAVIAARIGMTRAWAQKLVERGRETDQLD